MNTHEETVITSGSDEPLFYHGLSLAQLAQRIVGQDDLLALSEFHNHRTPFRTTGRGGLRFIEFLDELREGPTSYRLLGSGANQRERAFDLTVDKFTNLPSRRFGGKPVKRGGADCRYYFQAFLDCFEMTKDQRGITDPLRQEALAASLLQGGVVRQFYLSCLEARRNGNPTVSRYSWHVDHGVLSLWMPVSMSGWGRRQWLLANVTDADPSRPGERQRVQGLIDRLLNMPKVERLDEGVHQTAGGNDSGDAASAWLEREATVHGLAKIVADEKAQNISRQRPAIRAIGRRPLKKMILRIFDDLSRDQYEEGKLARAFGLSKATFSRFAGSQWGSGDSGRIPDLWANTAQTLAAHRPFVEAAQEAGIWQRVQDTLARSPMSRRPTDE